MEDILVFNITPVPSIKGLMEIYLTECVLLKILLKFENILSFIICQRSIILTILYPFNAN